jgi:hypothetical protein
VSRWRVPFLLFMLAGRSSAGSSIVREKEIVQRDEAVAAVFQRRHYE